jgi:hypothetical protein
LVKTFINAALRDLYPYFYVQPAPDESLSTSDLVFEYDFTPADGCERILGIEFYDEDGEWVFHKRYLEWFSIDGGVCLKFRRDPGSYPLRVHYLQRPHTLSDDLDTLETTAGIPTESQEAIVAFCQWRMWQRALEDKAMVELLSSASDQGPVERITIAMQLAQQTYMLARENNKMKPARMVVQR